MVGACAMGPGRVELDGKFRKPEDEEEARAKIMTHFERIGTQIMNRSGGGGPFDHDPIAGVLNDRDKRRTATQLLGQAYVHAHHLIAANKDEVERIAEVVIERKELYGNELVDLLERADLQVPEVDLTEEQAWPKI